jgi:hypothetical protein
MLFRYANADWASDINDRKLTSGYTFKLAGAAVSWSSKKQTSIALSSTEAEYISGAHATKEAIWLRQLLSELGLDTSSLTILHVDNQSTIAITKNPEFHDHTKHIDIHYHFLWQVVKDRTVELQYTPTGDQVADTLTKGLPPASFNKFQNAMGVCRLG